MHLSDRAVVFLATGCFVGKIPLAPGTFGTMVALPACWLLAKTTIWTALALILIFVVASVIIAQRAQDILGQHDPGSVVIDEIAGMMVTLAGLPFNFFVVAAGFCLFRVLDILKPYPISYFDQKISGGLGVVMDDVAAGVIANIIIRLVLSVQFQPSF